MLTAAGLDENMVPKREYPEDLSAVPIGTKVLGEFATVILVQGIKVYDITKGT